MVFLGRQARKGVIVWAGVTDPDYHREMGPVHNGGNEEYVWNTGDPFGCLRMKMPCEEGQ